MPNLKNVLLDSNYEFGRDIARTCWYNNYNVVYWCCHYHDSMNLVDNILFIVIVKLFMLVTLFHEGF
jgi:hypothetical protein